MVEASIVRMVCVSHTKVPFPEQGRPVAKLLECVSQCPLVWVHSLAGWRQVCLVPESLLVSACQESCPGRAADGCRHVSIGKYHAIACQGIDVGSFQVSAALETEIDKPGIICKDYENVGSARASRP